MIQWSCLTCAAGVVRRMKTLSLVKRMLKAKMVLVTTVVGLESPS